MAELKTGLWQKKSKNGNQYLSGRIEIKGETYFISIFNNNFKKNNNSPDATLYLRPSGEENYSQDPEDNKEPQGFAYVDENIVGIPF